MNTKDTKVEEVRNEILPMDAAFRSGFQMMLGRGIAFLASFVVVTVMGRFVPREVVGSYNFVIATLAIVSIATLPGMNSALSRAVSRGYDATTKTVMFTRLRWGLMGSIASFIIGIICLFIGKPQLGGAFLIASPFVPLTDTWSSSTFAFWQGKKQFKQSALFTALYYIGLALITIPVLLLTNNLIIIVLFVMIAQAILGFSVYKSIRHEKDITDPEALSLGKNLSIMQALQILGSNTDRVITLVLFGPALTAVYALAALPVSKAWQLLPIGIVSLPHLSTHSLTHEVKRIILKKTGTLFLITIPASGLAILLAPFLYNLFFPLYPDSVIFFQILIASFAFAPVILLKSALTAFQQTQLLYISEICTPLLKIGLMIGLGYAYGLIGIALGAALTSVFDFILVFFLFARSRPAPEQN